MNSLARRRASYAATVSRALRRAGHGILYRHDRVREGVFVTGSEDGTVTVHIDYNEHREGVRRLAALLPSIDSMGFPYRIEVTPETLHVTVSVSGKPNQ